MTESFDDAMAFAQKISDCEFGAHPNESVREWCEMSDYDGTCVVCLNRLLDRLQRAHESDIAILQNEHERRIIELQRAHEREMETVRDPRRIGGRHAPDSFAYAIEQLREFRWQHATNDDDAIPYINGVARAHEHEIEHLRKERFREGYEAGQRSMDAEHYQLKLRLQGIRFEGGSHENLSKLAYAIYPCATGWTCESCEGLRDELVRLLGGVVGTCPNANRTCPNPVQHASITDDGSDHESAQGGESGDADCADCHRRCGESGRVDERDSQKAQILANSDGDDGGKDTITDELRKYNNKQIKWLDASKVHYRNLIAIADRIDEQHEAILQSTVENTTTTDELHRAAAVFAGCDECGEYKQSYYEAYERMKAAEHERDELRKKLDSMTQEYLAMRSALNTSSTALRNTLAERNELQEKLDEANAAIANWREREKSFAESERLREEMQAKLDAYDQTHVELPKDENGEHIHVCDVVEDVEDDAYFDGSRMVTELKLYADGEWNVGAKEEIGDRVEWFEPCDLRHAKQASTDTAESIVRGLTLGTITEREAVRRIQRIADGTAEALDGRR